MRPAPTALLLPTLWTLVQLCGAAPAAAEAPARTLAVATPSGAPELAVAIRDGWFFRWVLPRLEVRVEVGEAALGERRVEVLAWPPDPESLRRLAGLPVAVSGDALRFDGSDYQAATVTAALRLPAARRSAGDPEWLVLGASPRGIAEVVSDLLSWLTRGGGDGVDYLLRESPWLARQGAWRPDGEHWAVDRGRDDDGFAERARWRAGLEPIAGRWVRLLVPAGRRMDAELARLAADLDAAVAAMAPRLPLAAESLARPLAVAVEEDFPSQVRHAGGLGAAVPGGPADLHLVFHPDDLFAYRYALAGRLLARSSCCAALPLWLGRGAALWLAGDWYGRPWRDWLAPLAAAEVLPSATELLAAEESPTPSEPLWTPVVAAVIDELPGPTLAAKLAVVPGEPAMAALLARIAHRARAAPPPPRVPPPPPRVPPAAPLPFLRGVSLAMYNSLDGGYHAPSIDAELDRLATLGADAVSLMPFAFQRDPHRPELAFANRSPASETDTGLVHAARRAHAHGFRVLLKPHLWVSGNSWAGEVEMTSEADWAAWFAGYRRYVLHHAFLAAWARAEVFSVGVELVKTLPREAEWRRLIADVRQLYPGVVTYSSNWHGGLDGAPFWDALDVIGVDAYYPLAGGADAGPEELILGARRIAEELAVAASHHRRPLLLTEVGFAARRGAWMEPASEGGELSEEDQARAYRALVAAFGRRPTWLEGVFVWKAFSGGPATADRPDFRFLGRPAEAEVRRWFRDEP